MSASVIYKYRCQKDHDGSDFLIEFLQGDDNDNFGNHLLESIQELNPQLEEKQDLWMNDEVLFRLKSNAGSFTISKDNWTTFILAEHNAHIILLIHDLLRKDGRFDHID